MATDRIAIRIDPQLHDWLSQRQQRFYSPSASKQADSDLSMLRGLLELEAQAVPLTVSECSALAETAAGTVIDATLGQTLAVDLMEAMHHASAAPAGLPAHPDNTVAARHGINEDELLAKLRGLTVTQDLAVRDALSRWWAADGEVTAEGFRQVGLHVTDTAVGRH